MNHEDTTSNGIRDAALEETLATIEERRGQIVNRSTIMLAASSAVMVLAGQSFYDLATSDSYSGQGASNITMVWITLLTSVVIGALSVLFSLGLIKVISRNRHKGTKQRRNIKNIFYFGWLVEQDEKGYSELLSEMTSDDYARYRARQIISLSANLKYRYSLLRASYVSFAISLFCYVAAMVMYYFTGL